MSNKPDEAAAGGIEPTEPRRLGRGTAALCRWIGWWVASGLVMQAGVLARWRLEPTMAWDRSAIEWCFGTGAMGVLLVVLLWRWRRDKDGAVAAAVLTAGFWAAIWIVVWPLF